MGRIPFKISGGADTEPASAGVAYDGPMPKGKVPYRCKLKKLTLKLNSNKDYMLNFVAEIAEPKTKDGKKNDKAECNGYGMWGNLNITDQGKPWVNQFLYALVNDEKKIKAVLKEFWAGGPRVDDEDKAQPSIVAIGTFKINPDGMPIVVQGKRETYQGDEAIKADRFLILQSKPGDDEESDEDESEEYADEDESDEEVAEDEEADEELPEGYVERDQELSGLTRPKLVAQAKANGITATKGVSDDDLITMILDAEFPPEEDEEEAAEESDEEESDEEESEEDGEEEEDEEEEPPAKPARRTRATAAAASKPAATKPAARGRRSRTDNDEVPY